MRWFQQTVCFLKWFVILLQSTLTCCGPCVLSFIGSMAQTAGLYCSSSSCPFLCTLTSTHYVWSTTHYTWKHGWDPWVRLQTAWCCFSRTTVWLKYTFHAQLSSLTADALTLSPLKMTQHCMLLLKLMDQYTWLVTVHSTSGKFHVRFVL